MMEITEHSLEAQLKARYDDARVILGSTTLPVSGIVVSEGFEGQADLNRSQAVRRELRNALGSDTEAQIYLEPFTPEEFQRAMVPSGAAE